MYTGKLQFAKPDYLSTWLRVVLHMRNVGVPSWFCHRLIDTVLQRHVRKILDGKAFMPVAFGTYRVLRKIYKNLIFQPFIRPFKYLRRKPRYEELHPEDEVTLPRNNMGAGGTEPAAPVREPAVAASAGAPASRRRWTVPQNNKLASRVRKPLEMLQSA